MKNCSKCGQDRPFIEFNKAARSKDGFQPWCNPCHLLYQKDRRKDPVVAQKNREASRGYYHRTYSERREVILTRNQEAKLKARYGITTADYVRMLEEQDGKCGICKTDSPGGRGNRFHVDHSHETGRVRGLLCWNCNRRLGVLENKEFVRAAKMWILDQ